MAHSRLQLDDAAAQEPVQQNGASTPGGSLFVQTPGGTFRASLPAMFRSTTSGEVSQTDGTPFHSAKTQNFKASASTTVRSLDYTRSVASKRSNRTASGSGNMKPWILTPRADIVFGIVIILHAVFLGIDIEASLRSPSGAPEGELIVVLLCAELVFTAIFSVELIARVCALGWDFICSLSGIFDASLVAFSLLDLLFKFIKNVYNPARFVGAFRVVRLLRLVRIARLLHIFPELQLLTSGLISTLSATAWAMVLIALFCYVGALVCADILGRSDDALVQEYFGSVGLSYLSQVQLSMVEAWPDVGEAMVQESVFWAYYVVFFIIVANFAMLNVVTGVVCDQVLALASRRPPQKPSQQRRQMAEIRDELAVLFGTLPLNQSSKASTLHCACLLEERRAQHILQRLGTGLPLQRRELCTLIDEGGVGELSLEEFVRGVLRLRGTEDDRITLPLQHSILERSQQVNKQATRVETRLAQHLHSSICQADELLLHEVESVRNILDELAHVHKPKAGHAASYDGPPDATLRACKELRSSLAAVSDTIRDLATASIEPRAAPESRSAGTQTALPRDTHWKGGHCCLTQWHSQHQASSTSTTDAVKKRDLDMQVLSEAADEPPRLKRGLSIKDRRRLGIATNHDAAEDHPLKGMDLSSVNYPLVPHRSGHSQKHWSWKSDTPGGKSRWHWEGTAPEQPAATAQPPEPPRQVATRQPRAPLVPQPLQQHQQEEWQEWQQVQHHQVAADFPQQHSSTGEAAQQPEESRGLQRELQIEEAEDADDIRSSEQSAGTGSSSNSGTGSDSLSSSSSAGETREPSSGDGNSSATLHSQHDV